MENVTNKEINISIQSFHKFIDIKHLSYNDFSPIESLSDISDIYVNNFIS